MELKRMLNNRKAYYFSLDALIAIILLIGILMFMHPIQKVSPPEMNLQDDAVQVLSSISVQDYNSSGNGHNLLNQLVISGEITDTNQSLLEALVGLYAKGDKENATALSNSIMSDFNYANLGLWFDDAPIGGSASSLDINKEKYIWNARESISGIALPSETGSGLTGYSASASLKSKYDSEYFYFGGYIGQGNITAKMHYEGNISTVYLEGVFSGDFNVSVNGHPAGSYGKSPDKITPRNYSIPIGNFSSGDNYIKLIPSSNASSFYISGGYIRILYKSSNNYEAPTRFYLPGIEGVINIYDSFYIPSDLSSMTLHLNYTNNYTNFFIIGNKTVFNGTSAVNTVVDVSDASLRASLSNYAGLSNQTIPIRYGLANFTQSIGAGNADVVLITDISGSMNYRMDSTDITSGTPRACNDAHLLNGDTQRLSLAKCLDINFTQTVLSNPGNRLALVDFDFDARGTALTNNVTSLLSNISLYNPAGGTCTACAINYAYNILSNQSSSGRLKYIILMSDGIASDAPKNSSGNCSTQKGTGIVSSTCSDDGCPGGNLPADCTNNFCLPLMNNANWSSFRTNKDLNATINTIGFGPVINCYNGNWTLNAVAKSGKGIYCFGQNSSDAKNCYQNFSSGILTASYANQTVNSTINNTYLSPDSYIEVNYPSSSIPFGEIITTETPVFGNNLTTGTLFLPEAEEYLDAKVVSYSGDLWTDKVYFKNQSDTLLGKPWKKVFNLKDYNLPYSSLGDPYMINIPKSLLVNGSNTINISAATSDLSTRTGSSYDKAIYTFRRNFLSPSPIKEKAVGCNWSITFYDGSSLIIPVFKENVTPTNIICNYSNLNNYDSHDAVQYATKQLLDSLDFSNPKDGKVDVKFDSQDLEVSNILWDNIPFATSTEVRISTWR